MLVTRQDYADALRALLLGVAVAGISTMAALRGPGPEAFDPQDGFHVEPLGALAYLLIAGAAVPLAARRRFPLPVFVVSLGFAFAYYAVGSPGGPAIVLPAFALYTVTTVRGPIVASAAGGAGVVAAYVAYVVRGGDWLPDARAAGVLAGVAAVLGIGTAVRNRRAALRAAREQETEHRLRLGEEERLRVAREVHDVVAHSLAMINVQAGVAVHVADRKPEQAKEALQHIKEASATALTDLRATLAVLRAEAGAHAPAPGLRQLADLVGHAESAGLVVRVDGEPGELPAPVDAAAYRILQESITNVVRHAHEASAIDVRFARTDATLRLSVRDDGRAAAVPGTSGNGLRGMRERAEALGGAVEAGPGHGGFEVSAVLPIGGGS